MRRYRVLSRLQIHRLTNRKKKGQPRLRLAFLTDAYLLAEQRFDIQPLRLQDFAQTAQAFNLNLANTFTGEANFTTYIFQCCRFVPQQTESTCQHFTLFGVQLEQPRCSASYRHLAWYLPDRSLFHRPGCPATLFRNHHPAGCLPR